MGSNPAAPTNFQGYNFFETAADKFEVTDVTKHEQPKTPRGSLALAFIKKINWWYGIVWLCLATWILIRWGLEGY